MAGIALWSAVLTAVQNGKSVCLSFRVRTTCPRLYINLDIPDSDDDELVCLKSSPTLY